MNYGIIARTFILNPNVERGGFLEQSRLNEFLILEDRILEDRRMLVNMTREINNPETEFIKRMLATLEIELQHMSGQIDYMKRK